MFKKWTTLFVLVLVSAFVAAAAGAAELTADEIVAKANRAAYYAGRDGRADVTMTIFDGKGGERVRKFTLLRMNTGDKDQKFYTYFREPADVYKMAYLVWKHVGKKDDRWLWLPALNLKKRIAPGDKRTSFVGSDFLYEDVSGRGTGEDTHQLLEAGADAFVINNVPKDPGAVEFAYYHVWIDKQTFLPVKAEYYDRSGSLYRRVEALQIESIQGYPTVLVSKASDLKSGSSTVNEFKGVKYDIGLKERIFTERFLRRPPREVTR